MWMKRHIRKPACGAKNGVARRPSHVFIVPSLEAEWWLASWLTVKRTNAAIALRITLGHHGQVSVQRQRGARDEDR